MQQEIIMKSLQNIENTIGTELPLIKRQHDKLRSEVAENFRILIKDGPDAKSFPVHKQTSQVEYLQQLCFQIQSHLESKLRKET